MSVYYIEPETKRMIGIGVELPVGKVTAAARRAEEKARQQLRAELDKRGIHGYELKIVSAWDPIEKRQTAALQAFYL